MAIDRQTKKSVQHSSHVAGVCLHIGATKDSRRGVAVVGKVGNTIECLLHLFPNVAAIFV